MSASISNNVAQTAETHISSGPNGLQIAFAGNAPGTTVFAGVGGAVSQELKAITGSNLLAGDEVIDLLSDLLTSGGKRGGPIGVESVEIVSVVEDAVVVNFTKGSTTDTITFDDGLLDKELGGGQNAGDAKSTYAVIDTDGGKNGKGESIIGTAFLGKIDKDHSVGGFSRGEKDVKTLLEAALDEDYSAVQLAGLEADSFSVTISRGSATDTYTF